MYPPNNIFRYQSQFQGTYVTPNHIIGLNDTIIVHNYNRKINHFKLIKEKV